MAEPALSASIPPGPQDGALAQLSTDIDQLATVQDRPLTLSELKTLWTSNYAIQNAMVQIASGELSTQKWITVPDIAGSVRITTYSLRQFCLAFISATQTTLFNEKKILNPDRQNSEAGQTFQKIFRLGQVPNNIWQLITGVNTVASQFDDLFTEVSDEGKRETSDDDERRRVRREVAAPVAEAATAVIPTVIFNQQIFTTTDQSSERATQRTRSSYQVISVHTGFLQNQIAEALFSAHHINPDGRAFDNLPPHLKYLINTQIAQSLHLIGAETASQLDRFEQGQRILRQLLQTDPSFAVELKTFLQGYAQTHPENIRDESGQPRPTEEIVEELNQTIPTLENIETATPETYSTKVAQSFAELPVTLQEEKANNDFNALVVTGYLAPNAAEMEAEFMRVGSQHGLKPDKVITLQQLFDEAILRHEDPQTTVYGLESNTMFTRLVPEINSFSKQHLENLKMASINYWRNRLALYNVVLQNPIVGNVISTPTDPQVLDSITQAPPGSLPQITVTSAENTAFAERQLLTTQLRPEIPDEHYAMKLTLGFHASPTQLTKAGRDSIEKNVLYPVYEQPQKVRSALNEIHSYNLAARQTILSFVIPQEGQVVEQIMRRYYFSIAPTQEVLTMTPNQLLGVVPPYIAWDAEDSGQVAYAPGDAQASQLNFFQPGRWKGLIDRVRGVKTAKDVAQTAQAATKAASKITRLSQTLRQVAEVAKRARQLTNLAKILGLIKGLIAGIMAALGPLLGGLAALGGGIIAGLGSLLGVIGIPLLVGGAIAAVGGFLSSILGGTVQAATGIQPFTQPAPPAGQAPGLADKASELADKAKTAAKDFLSTSGGQALAAGGGIGAAMLVITLNTQGAFLTELPTLTARGEISPYVTIDKEAIDAATGKAISGAEEITADINVTYRITITPKDDYVLTIKRLSDSQSVRFNEDLLEEEGREIPNIPLEERLYEAAEGGTQDPSIADDIATATAAETFPELNPGESLVIEYPDVFTPEYQDAAVLNTFAIIFDYQNPAGEQGIDESASVEHKLCFGECPVGEGGLWPVCGTIGQFPFNDPPGRPGETWSHDPGVWRAEGEDAYDIGTGGENRPVHAPLAGRVCAKPYDANEEGKGYGTYLVLDQIPGASYRLTFAHLHATIFGSSSDECKQVEPGEFIGYSGNSGTGAIHLHYELVPPAGIGGPSILRTLVPPEDVDVPLGFAITNCYAP